MLNVIHDYSFIVFLNPGFSFGFNTSTMTGCKHPLSTEFVHISNNTVLQVVSYNSYLIYFVRKQVSKRSGQLKIKV